MGGQIQKSAVEICFTEVIHNMMGDIPTNMIDSLLLTFLMGPKNSIFIEHLYIKKN